MYKIIIKFTFIVFLFSNHVSADVFVDFNVTGNERVTDRTILNFSRQLASFYGSSRIDLSNGQVSVNNYGSGTVCGGSVLKYDSSIYRSYDGGIAILDEQLNILDETKIGSYNPSQLYSSEVIGDLIYFGITNYSDINQVKVVDFNNNEIASYEVGLFPGDFAYWESN